MSDNIIKERPISFNGPMIRAILEGRKTVTRQVMKPQPNLIYGITDVTNGYLAPGPFQIGQILWVRETWQAQEPDGSWWHQIRPEDRPLYNWARTNPIEPAYNRTPPRWLPSIHMPRDVCRITLEITDVQVQRLWQMAVNDMLAEGVAEGPEDDGKHPLAPFIELWDGINTRRGYPWQSNCWVWVISFKDYITATGPP